MDADRQLHLVRLPQILKDQLGEAAGVAEDDGGLVSLDLRHHLRRGIAAGMARPGHAILGQQDGDIGIDAGFALHQADAVDIAVGGEPGAIAVGIGDRGGQGDAAQAGRDRLKPRHA